MSLGSSNMAGTALGTAFFLLLFASVIQGFPDVERTRSETTEAVVGQNFTLRCTIKSNPYLKIVNVEWRKKDTKVALYSQAYGVNLFWPNVTVQIENNTEKEFMGSYLHLPAVNEWDGGIYICDVASFPYGSIRRDTELKIKDAIKVTCDADSTVDVHDGENVTIHCRASSNAQYRWTKNEELVSEMETLELWWVTDAYAGVYTLTVNTGKQSVQKEFIITVLTATTSLSADPSTVSPQSYVTEEDLMEPANSSLTTSPTTGLSSTDTSVTWAISMRTNAKDDSPSPGNVTIAVGEHTTSFTNETHVSVTSSPATHTHTDPFLLINSTSLSYGSEVFRSTQEMASDDTPTLHSVHPSIRPKESSTLGNVTENDGAGNAKEGKDTERSHLAVIIIVLILALIVVAGFLYRRHIIKQRMALPPPFKPPPPPVKYIAARHLETSTQPFPVARCNSVTELKSYETNIY